MFQSRRLIITPLLMGVVLFLGYPLDGQTVMSPIASPAAIKPGTQSTVVVSALVVPGANQSVLANGVNLLAVTQPGATLSTLGVLSDSGINGDAVPGDGRYSGTFTFSPSADGYIYLRVSAAFKGQLQRALSPILGLPVVSTPIPITTSLLNENDIVLDPVSGQQVVCNELLVSFNDSVPTGLVTQTVSLVS